MSYPPKEIVINLLSVVAGVLTGYFLFLFSGILGYGVSNITGAIFANILPTLIYLVLPTFGAGYITAIISTRYDKIHIVITGIVLAAVIIPGIAWDSIKSYEDLIFPVLAMILTIIGGLIGIYLKKKEKTNLNKEPYPPDTPSK